MSLHQDKPEIPADVETADCPECGKEFIVKTPGQKLCTAPACNGARGAAKRIYRKPKAKEP